MNHLIRNQWIRKSNGFSLIEVVISLLILSLALLAIAGLHVTSIYGNSFANRLTQATYVIQDRLESLKYLPLESELLAVGTHDEGSITFSGTVFNRSYTVALNNNLRTINYTVTYNDGTNHTISFMTMRSE